MNIDLCLKRFRLASREVLNSYFRPIKDQKNWSDSSILYTSFIEIEKELFRRLVSEPAELQPIVYGGLQEDIGVEGIAKSDHEFHEVCYSEPATWDYTLSTFPKDTTFLFIRFVDPDPLKAFDNQFILVELKACPRFPELVGRRVPIQYCSSKFYKV